MKKLIFMGLCLALSSGLHAQTAQADPAAQSKKAAEPSCQETSPFVPPSIPWMGRYFYKVKVTLKNGQATEVEAKAVRGLDTVSDQIVEQSLQEHIKKNFVCEGAGATITFHLALIFEHELEALDQKQAELDAKTAASAATGLASEALIPLRADQICTSMGKPVVPDVYAVGTLILHAIAEVKDSKVTFVDIKLMRGSTDASVNEKFIKAIERAMRRTYVCPGNHVFEQEFQFSIS